MLSFFSEGELPGEVDIPFIQRDYSVSFVSRCSGSCMWYIIHQCYGMVFSLLTTYIAPLRKSGRHA